MRAWRRVSIHWGLVDIPVGLYKSTESHDIGFHRHHKDCGGAIKQPWTCEKCGKFANGETVTSGYQYDDGTPDGQLITITKEEMDDLRAERSDKVEVVQFSPAHQVDPLLWENSYFLEPSGSGDGYGMLLETMEADNVVAIVSMVLTTRPTMGVVRVSEMGGRKGLALHTIRWHDEVRDVSTLKDYDHSLVTEEGLDMTSFLVKKATKDFDPTMFNDDFTQRVDELIEAKAKGDEFLTEPHDLDEEPSDVSDLLAKLRASVAAQENRRDELADSVNNHPASRAKKVTVAKKAPAKKAAPTKKAPAKVTAKKAAPRKAVARTARQKTA